MSDIVAMIRITRLPEGEAPEWVRQASVGYEFPCASIVGYPPNPTRGVLSLKEHERNRYGYTVSQKEFLNILGKDFPEVVAWWQSKGFPKTNPDEENFFFDESEAMLVQGVVKHQKITVYDDVESGHWRPQFS